MGAGSAAMLLGALVPTFLLSRLLLWITKRWNGGVPRLLVVHVICGALAVVAAAYGYSHTGAPDWSRSPLYVVAQLIWLIVDFLRGRRRRQSQPAS
ncbi:hypothetical protein FJW07_06665 [Mesorhizobium sp. B3-1-9]|uniref:hypothetical protein n=1 Tax=unclassified Mesorhizobium TaxID=325217 RepID=UPI00112A27A4|nr:MULTISPECIES: hypothetical protein [unclassified Mesorhizobium]TPI40943.1 hypothetical protein FJW07_06665 [Mesorhizobium sp. B3-1-9]TPI52800.1 hypothetical protein FJ424_32450 [Mesorhizobium sp. B3-1-8]TPI62926.1 hypothetical protein FJ420_29200 [Mesorhizobium sp. B3-1-3]TPJ32000.1 hypothetical protein FJ418_21145 [Mesorhizobium sp. B2-8-3]UCI24595.1 hypothetical protein FJ430_23820 [Mesorhizobium sp. B2-8-5]